MPRIPKDIQHISERDTKAFRLLWNTEHSPRHLLDLTEHRIKTLERQGLVDKCRDINGNEIIRCTVKGRDYIGKLPDFQERKPYVSSTATAHNCELARIYSTLSPDQQEHWRTERELADLYEQRMEELRYSDYDRWREYENREWSSCDGAIVSDSGEVEQIIEVITNNYGDLEIKVICSEVLNAPIEFYKI